jgi:VanZ family protein
MFGVNSVEAKLSQSYEAASIEAWLQPGRIWDSGTFLALYRENLRSVSLRQAQTDLVLQVESYGPDRYKRTSIRVADVFRRTTPPFITLTSNGQGTLIYVDGVMARAVPGFRLSAADFAGRLVIGDSPRESDSWKGQFLGLAFYEQALTARQTLGHYETWTKAGRPDLTVDDRPVALYVFNEHTGTVVHSRIGSGSLYIPEQYTVLDKKSLKPPWQEFEMSRNYWGAVVKNVIGFIPLGACFYAYWSIARTLRRPALATIVTGAAVSFTIEFLQTYLPTRDSGMTDLITNTTGTVLGILLDRIILALSAANTSFARLTGLPTATASGGTNAARTRATARVVRLSGPR